MELVTQQGRCLLFREYKRPFSKRLRQYQEECVNACLVKYMEGRRHQLVSLPTGSGKTIVFCHLLQEFPPPSLRATKTLIIVNQLLQVDQIHAQLTSSGSDLAMSIDQGRSSPDMSSDVVIASIQSIGRESPRPSKSRLLHYNPELFKCIIVDEAHHATSDTYTRVFQYFGVHKAESQLLVVGFTATAWRHDGIRLDAVFKDIVYHKSFLSMVQEEWLCNLRIERVTTGLDLWDVKITKDFESRQLAKKINTDKRNASVVKAYEDHCAGNRRATIVFAADVKHAKTLTKEFEDRGHVAYCISSQIPPNERAGLVQRFRDGEIPILVNCEMLTEGVDIPIVDAIIMARPTYSTVLMVQMLGRGVRLYPEKTDCLVLDMTDTVNGEVLHTLPTLLGQDPKATSFAITSR
ncbi:P-loop containing nucleoside triphosphate hydrolase protein [Mortierella sp. GBAus27b]|nr:P-loop containing nucleoside triphosphate hydrolase protein [Mortierella sp. GBAus27b]